MIVVEVWYRISQVRREDRWASALQKAADGWIAGFGASDCRCPSHLFRFVRRPNLPRLLRERLDVFHPERSTAHEINLRVVEDDASPDHVAQG
jgi:Uri superfamily endonuclease